MGSSYTQCTSCGALAKTGEQKVAHRDRLRCASCGAVYPATSPENVIAALRARVRELEALADLGRRAVQSVPTFHRDEGGYVRLDGVMARGETWYAAVDAAKAAKAEEAERA